MVRRLIIGAVVGVAAVILVTFVLLPVLSPANAMDLPYRQGQNGSYAYGSCSYFQFNLGKPAMITGSFVTSSSATFFVTVPAQLYPGDGGCLKTPEYYYTSGNVRDSSLNFTLAPGTYWVGFAFTNQTGGQTWLNITKGFVASYIPAQADYGPSCVSISCYQNHLGPEGPNGAR